MANDFSHTYFIRQTIWQKYFVIILLKNAQLHLKKGTIDYCRLLRENGINVSPGILNNIIESKSKTIRNDYFWLSVCEKTKLNYDKIMAESLQLYLDQEKDKFRYIPKEQRDRGLHAEENNIRKIINEI